jgi:D-galactarolactone cycloisomerase
VRVARNAAAAVAAGYRAIKLHEITEPAVAAARAAVGPDVLLMNDTNCPWTPDEAVAMARAVRPHGLHWLEEPVWPPEDHDGLARVRREGVPIAAGENAASLVDFRHMMRAGAVDVAQPSVTKIGGVSEVLKVAALGEAMGVTVVPHCAYFGPGFLASLHLAATLPGRPMLERLHVALAASPSGPWSDAADGVLRVPTAPGLGHDPAPELFDRYEVRP